MTLQQCRITGFYKHTTTDHRKLYIGPFHTMLLKNKTIYLPSLFNRKLQSKCPTSILIYKKYLKKKTKQNLEPKVKELLKIAQQRRLTTNEDDELNKVDKKITSIMIGAEKKINNQQRSP